MTPLVFIRTCLKKIYESCEQYDPSYWMCECDCGLTMQCGRYRRINGSR